MATDKPAEATLSATVALARLPAVRPFAHLFDRLAMGHLRLRIGDGVHEMRGAEPGPAAEMRIHHPLNLFRRIATKGILGLGEAYLAGDWDTPDLPTLLYLLSANERGFRAMWQRRTPHRLLSLFKHRRRTNSRRGSRRNIRYHYDLGNAFYRLWLDPGMTYSAALFEPVPGSKLGSHQTTLDRDQAGLELAQVRKYQRMLALTGARPGQHILEIGCGWGGFALTAAAAGMRVTGVTLSTEQLAHARAAVAAAGYADRVELRLQDYRDIDEQFDHIVSIEMFEAVGEDYWPAYMQQLRKSLRPGGRAALQLITIDEAMFEDYRRDPDFIQHYIFPGGMLPSEPRFERCVAEAGLQICEASRHGHDYADTIALWHQRFDAHADAVRALGYDERFLRMWRYYLAYCEAGFRDRRIDVLQVALAAA